MSIVPVPADSRQARIDVSSMRTDSVPRLSRTDLRKQAFVFYDPGVVIPKD